MTNQEKRYLIFTMGGDLYAFDLSQLAEVSEPPSLWPIPSSPHHYPGAMNFHGNIVAVMDLPGFMGINNSSKPEKLVVLDNRLASLGFLVEQVLRIVPESEIIRMDTQVEGFICGAFSVSEGNVTLLDPVKIVNRATASIND